MYKKMLRLSLCTALFLAGTAASAGCYNVYNGRGKLVERDANPPVNMSKHLRHTVPTKYGRGSTMVFEAPEGSSCEGFSTVRKGKKGGTTVQDTDALLDNLARLHTDPRGQIQYRTDQWLADVEFK